LIRVTSSGPILFRQHRVGQDGELFEILKFRTMFHAINSGPGVTRSGDRRITRIGRILRRTKLDELPQLFNVLTGKMSLVGPRPDLPEYYCTLAPEYLPIVKLRPGVTGWATLHFRHEEELLAGVPEPDTFQFYVGTVLPEKARLALDYATRATFLSDVQIVLRTILHL
jgi:lipopolysaccharide/colanic/teichoic acid biosynthesis glycosyltransferase